MNIRSINSVFFKHKKRIFSIMYSWGAAIILIGVLFKLTHLPYAKEMLFIGMICEIIVFFFSAFDPVENKTNEQEQCEALNTTERNTHIEIAELNQNIKQLNILIEELIRKEHAPFQQERDVEANTEKMISALAEMNKSYLSILHIQDKVLSKQQTYKESGYEK